MIGSLIAQVRDPRAGEEVVDDILTLKGFEYIFNNVVTIVLGLAGIVFFFLLVVGGFKFLTSGGDPKAVDSAKKTLTYAIGGFIVIVLSYLILRFISSFTGVETEVFRISLP